MKKRKIAVLCGGISSEREVSLVSGKSVFEALKKNFDAELFVLDKNELPKEISPETHAVFIAMHGEYGEDGTIQKELEDAGFSYAGTPPLASKVCMNKPAAKALLKQAGIKVAKEILFDASDKPDANFAFSYLGEKTILKPADKGSSVGLQIISSLDEMKEALSQVKEGLWLLEEYYQGREFAVGVIYGEPAGVVEIKPKYGIYDYQSKYTKGATNYEFPAKITKQEESKIRNAAKLAYETCGCRDFSRVDFLMKSADDFIVVEINTLPGMTPTSLLPKSASCIGYDFESLCAKMVERAVGKE